MIDSAPKGLPCKEIPNTQVADAAKQFRDTADFLLSHVEEQNCILPLLMVASFGIELYLKSLNSRNVYSQDDVDLAFDSYRVTAKPMKGHGLLMLFNAVDQRVHIELEQLYSANPQVKGMPTIRDALVAYDKLFVNARYPFENGRYKGGSNPPGLVGLLGLLGDYVHSLRPRIS